MHKIIFFPEKKLLKIKYVCIFRPVTQNTLIFLFGMTQFVFQDADYFLQLTQIEEERLQSLCSTCERELLNQSLPEDGEKH